MCLRVIAKMIKIIAITIIMISNGIQIGESTHSQDHDIVFVSFNTKNIKNKTVQKDIPEPEELFECAIL